MTIAAKIVARLRELAEVYRRVTPGERWTRHDEDQDLQCRFLNGVATAIEVEFVRPDPQTGELKPGEVDARVQTGGLFPKHCNACLRPLLIANLYVDDGCPCNSPRGVNVTPRACGICRVENCVKPGHHPIGGVRPRGQPCSCVAVGAYDRGDVERCAVHSTG